MLGHKSQKIDITGVDKALLLAGLFNSSKSPGMGFFSKGANTEMTAEAAQNHINNQERTTGKLKFDYLDGRYMKVDISGDELDPSQYDSVNGAGATRRVVDSIKANKKVPFGADLNALLASQMRELEDEDYSREQFMKAFDGPHPF